MSSQENMVFATNKTMNQSERGFDFYPTPDEAIKALLQRERFEGNIYECAVGAGAITDKLLEFGYMDVFGSDIREDSFYHSPSPNGLYRNTSGAGVDFLDKEQVNRFLAGRSVDNIITNPPFGTRFEPFAIHALELASRKVAFLARLSILEGQSRYRNLFSNQPLRTVYVFSHRIQFVEGKSNVMAMCWLVWEKGYTGRPQIEWITKDSI